MTNAEKLANDTDFMISALAAHCGNQEHCMWCKFARRSDDGEVVCTFAPNEEADTIAQMINWLKSENGR